MIKVIAFDYAGVIAPGPMTDWTKSNLDINGEKYKKYIEHAHKWDSGEMTIDEVYKVLSEITGIPKDLIWDKFYEKSIFNSGVVNIIKKLKNNYKVFLFSNFIAELLRKLLEKHKLSDLFDEIIISSDYKMKKPSTEFFDLLIRTSNVKKSEIVFIDDRLDNVEGAKNFGIDSILFKDADNLKIELKNRGITIDI